MYHVMDGVLLQLEFDEPTCAYKDSAGNEYSLYKNEVYSTKGVAISHAIRELEDQLESNLYNIEQAIAEISYCKQTLYKLACLVREL